MIAGRACVKRAPRSRSYIGFDTARSIAGEIEPPSAAFVDVDDRPSTIGNVPRVALSKVNPCADEDAVAPPPVRERVPARDVLTARHRHERRWTASDHVSEHVLVGVHLQHLGRQASKRTKGKRREPILRGVAVGADTVASNKRLALERVAAIESHDSGKSLRRDQHLVIVARRREYEVLDQEWDAGRVHPSSIATDVYSPPKWVRIGRSSRP